MRLGSDIDISTVIKLYQMGYMGFGMGEEHMMIDRYYVL
jgi:hypothetical protein